MDVRSIRPHDLLWLVEGAALRFEQPRPAWVTPPWLAVAPVVVRRAAFSDGTHNAIDLPVGLRGATRSERCAARASARDVLRVVTPEDVVRLWQRRASAAFIRGSTLPCWKALDQLAPRLAASSLAWGITGGAGFTLASGLDVLRPDSDLDLLIRAPRATDAGLLRDIAPMLTGLPARVDVQVETLVGAFALQEWLRTGGPVLMKTASGPLLSADPWRLPLDSTAASASPP